jgi:hypothetical protein
MAQSAEYLKKVEDEIERCAKDFDYFVRYLRIVDKRGRLVPFDPNSAQLQFQRDLEKNPWTYVLKARQMGFTTYIAARNIWRALFRPNFAVMVLAHRADSAQAIFDIYKRFYENLPEFLTFPTDKSNVRELRFFHGGLVRVATANSEGPRGTTYQALHCSEFAFWGNIDDTVAAAFQTCGPDAEIILETTANGLNDAHKMWVHENGFQKVFYPWTQDKGYVKEGKTGRIFPALAEAGRKFKIEKQQLCWAQHALQTKCMGNWHTFMQEYPFDAEMAFVTSGERFFDIVFPHSQAHTGMRVYSEPKPYRVYSMGVDTASGSPSGDFSAFCVTDVTDKDNPTVVATFYDRMPPHEFGDLVHQTSKKYEALVVPESNSYGLSIIEYLVGHEYAYMYRRTHYDKLGGRWVEKLGFQTTTSTRPMMLARLHEYVSKGKMEIIDERMKTEMNSFVYDEKGKPVASAGKHDDMIFAHGLSLIGMDQIEYVRDDVQRRAPTTMQELALYEMSTGKRYRSDTDDSHQEMYGIPSDQSRPLEAALDNSPSRR